MKAKEHLAKLYELAFTAEVNQRYYQIKYTQTWRLDKLVKVSVVSITVIALGCVFLPHDLKCLELAVAFLAVIAAVVLNVLPIGEWMTEYGAKCRLWNDQFIDVDVLRQRLAEKADDENAPDHFVEQLSELTVRQYQLDDEHAADEKLLEPCQGDVTNDCTAATFAPTSKRWRNTKRRTPQPEGVMRDTFAADPPKPPPPTQPTRPIRANPPPFRLPKPIPPPPPKPQPPPK